MSGVSAPIPHSHIIERPRLLKKLDEATGRLILLVAPAGYGKTTLARAWLKTRNATAYEGARAGRDIATLAIGISDSCDRILNGARDRMQERLRATRAPEEDAQILGAILSEDLEGWPQDAWLGLDDYHLVMEAPGSDAFVQTLFESTAINLLIATRKRPRWITSRRLLYGEALELDQQSLRMQIDEARQLMQERSPRYVARLVEQSRGWPAVLGLAAQAGTSASGIDDLPSELYEYFAEELFNTLSPSLQLDFQLLALLKNVDQRALQALYSDRLKSIIESGQRLGFLMKGAERMEVHPLLTSYLETQLATDSQRFELLEIALETLLHEKLWDEAFELCARFDLETKMIRVIESGAQALLEGGRLTTLNRWVSAARVRDISAPAVDLAEAQVALHQGQFEASELIALRLARGTSDVNLIARAYAVAGSAAHLDSRPEAYEYFTKTTETSEDETLVLQARIGQFLSALEFRPAITPQLISEIGDLDGLDAATTLRLLAYRIMYSHRVGELSEEGGLLAAVRRAEAAEPLLAQVTNPLARTAYLNTVGFGNCELARYRRARTFAVRLHQEGLRYRLALMMPYANFLLAASALGRGNFERARDICETAIAQAQSLNHVYAEMNSTALLARIMLGHGNSERALELTDIDLRRPPLPALAAEFVAVRALTLAAIGEPTKARATLEIPQGDFLDGQIRALRECTEAILLHTDGSDDGEVRRLIEAVLQRGQVDTFVFAYRAHPGLLRAVAEDTRLKVVLEQIFTETGDFELAVSEKIPARRDARRRDEISRREHEVLDLLAQGLRNREIAERLFIGEVTVKAHLRSAYRKLGVSSRTEAIVVWRLRGQS